MPGGPSGGIRLCRGANGKRWNLHRADGHVDEREMRPRRFRQSVRDLGTRLALAVWGAIGGAVGLFIAFLTSDVVDEYRWVAIPTGICFGLLLASHDLIREHERRERDAIQERDEARAEAFAARRELTAFKDAQPLVEFLEPKGTTVNIGDSKSFVVQARFVNRPKVRAPHAVARSVSALIEFWSAKGERLLNGPYYGAWASSAAPGHVGWTDLLPAVDFEGNDIPQKLYIALRPEGAAEAYVFCRENLHAHADGRHPNYKLVFGTYLVRVTLRGAALDQDFCFRLENGTAGREPLELEQCEPMSALRGVLHEKAAQQVDSAGRVLS